MAGETWSRGTWEGGDLSITVADQHVTAPFACVIPALGEEQQVSFGTDRLSMTGPLVWVTAQSAPKGGLAVHARAIDASQYSIYEDWPVAVLDTYDALTYPPHPDQIDEYHQALRRTGTAALAALTVLTMNPEV